MFLVSCIIYITEGRNRFLLFLYVEVNFTVLLSCFFEHKTFQSLTFYLKNHSFIFSHFVNYVVYTYSRYTDFSIAIFLCIIYQNTGYT